MERRIEGQHYGRGSRVLAEIDGFAVKSDPEEWQQDCPADLSLRRRWLFTREQPKDENFG